MDRAHTSKASGSAGLTGLQARASIETEAAIITPADAIWILASFCAPHNKSVDPALLAKQCVAPLRAPEFESLALTLGLEVALREDNLGGGREGERSRGAEGHGRLSGGDDRSIIATPRSG